MKKCKKIFIMKLVFLFHKVLRYYVLYGWFVHKRVLICQLIVMLSWYFNNNKCIVSQIEKYLFGQTFLQNNSIYVNNLHRQELYGLFIIGCIFNYLN